MPSRPVTLLWTLYGALIGFLIVWFDLFVEWRNVEFASWQGSGIAYNLGQFTGSIVVAAIIGAIAGTVRDRNFRREGKLIDLEYPSQANTVRRVEYAKSVGAIGRLGQVLYWIFVSIGLIVAGGAIAASIFYGSEALPIAIFGAIAATFSALLGLAFRHILAGPKPQKIRAALLLLHNRP